MIFNKKQLFFLQLFDCHNNKYFYLFNFLFPFSYIMIFCQFFFLVSLKYLTILKKNTRNFRFLLILVEIFLKRRNSVFKGDKLKGL